MQPNNFVQEAKGSNVAKRKRQVLDNVSDSDSDRFVPCAYRSSPKKKKSKRSEVAKHKSRERIDKNKQYDSDSCSDYESEKNTICFTCERLCTPQHSVKHNGYEIERQIERKQFRLQKQRRLLHNMKEKPIEYVVVQDDFSCDEVYGVVTVFNTSGDQKAKVDDNTEPIHVNALKKEKEDNEVATVSVITGDGQVSLNTNAPNANPAKLANGVHKDATVFDTTSEPMDFAISASNDTDLSLVGKMNHFKTSDYDSKIERSMGESSVE